MSDASEQLARQIRNALGERNDDQQPVTVLVAALRTFLADALGEVERLAAQVETQNKWCAADRDRATAAEAALAERDATIAGMRAALEAVLSEGFVPAYTPGGRWHQEYYDAFNKARQVLQAHRDGTSDKRGSEASDG